MDKFLLQQQVLERLAEDLLQAEQAVRAAHETATHEENIAENKYDTLGLEAAYLATGQARRAGLPGRFRRQAATAFSRAGWGQHEVDQRRSARSDYQQRSPTGKGHAG